MRLSLESTLYIFLRKSLTTLDSSSLQIYSPFSSIPVGIPGTLLVPEGDARSLVNCALVGMTASSLSLAVVSMNLSICEAYLLSMLFSFWLCRGAISPRTSLPLIISSSRKRRIHKRRRSHKLHRPLLSTAISFLSYGYSFLSPYKVFCCGRVLTDTLYVHRDEDYREIKH